MPVTRLLQIIAGVCGVIALTLGLGTYTNADLINIHMLFGLLVSLALLVQAILAASTSALRRLGIFSMVAFVEERFGLTIDPEDVTIEHFATIAAIESFVGAKQAAQAAQP